MKLAYAILAAVLLAGCAGSPRHDEQLRQSYRTGMTRDEAHALLGQASLLSSVSRPASGWSPADGGDHQAGMAAFRHEHDHPGSDVASCEVYWVGRHTSAPLAAGGVWWDYLFFDSHDKLLGHHRRFLD